MSVIQEVGTNKSIPSFMSVHVTLNATINFLKVERTPPRLICIIRGSGEFMSQHARVVLESVNPRSLLRGGLSAMHSWMLIVLTRRTDGQRYIDTRQ